MRMIGFLLTCLGFIGGTFILVVQTENVDWSYFLPIFFVGVLGVVFIRLATRKLNLQQDRVEANIGNIEESLARIVEKISKLSEDKSRIDVYDLPAEIDGRFMEDLDRFVTSRESMIYAYGLPQYASVMSHFAAGERYLNRVWSCSIDGYINEAHQYIEHAQEQFKEAQQQLKACQTSS